jgi:hypothetical protein
LVRAAKKNSAFVLRLINSLASIMFEAGRRARIDSKEVAT